MLGSTALGFYVLAFNLSSWPVAMFSLPLRNVAPPTFARLQHEPEAMRSAFRGLVGLLAAVTFPICLLLAGAAEPLIRFVYGDAWAPAASALTWLAVLAAFKILFELAYDYLVVIGASRAILALQVVTLVVLVPALIVGVQLSGISGAAAAQVVVAALVALPLYMILFSRAGVPVRKLLDRLWLPVLIAGGVGASAIALGDTVRSDVIAVMLAGLVALAALAGLVFKDRGELSRLRREGRSVSAVEAGGTGRLDAHFADHQALVARATELLARGRHDAVRRVRADGGPARLDEPHRVVRQRRARNPSAPARRHARARG